MEILVLGSGGFDNEGLPFNAFLVDRHILVECPPDILVSLGREGIDPGSIQAIYLSHTHADHCFGLPFMLFYFWKRGLKAPRLIGPGDLGEATLSMCALAISPHHPYLAWIQKEVAIETAGQGPLASLAGCVPEFYRTWHEKETWGLGLRRGEDLLFQYVPDTSWNEGLVEYFGLGAELLVCDVNGSGGVKTVHMSREELGAAIAGLPEGSKTQKRPALALGTHLSHQLPEGPREIATVHPGQVFELGLGPREALQNDLEAYSRSYPLEAKLSSAIGDFARRSIDAFSRECEEGHITGSGFVVDPSFSQVLLVHHAKLDRWLQPGGHCETGETAFEAALRECREETGLDPEPLLGARIFDLDIHEIPARDGRPAHLHYDVRFLFQAAVGKEAKSEESTAIAWVSLAEAVQRNPELSIRRPLARLEELRHRGLL